ncbi:hypothetical protein INS49_005664 [Diaporthe citri]|uniref:uncharacterized protein n=1 Tax=Diaporthe citri TaxID=83186 RepID=UPI001C7EE058|nr:uncharacterized protein INS49_005664 [Diaporthe citri]KAG6353483.1 hypothetical protein INS49_005664 [Diaporthe citri]
MLAFALLAGVVSARVLNLPGIPKGWEHVGPASPDEPIQLRLSLRQQGSPALEAAVLDRSTPGTANYGIHLSRGELQFYTAPSECTETSVMQWLREKNVPHSIEADWATIRTTVDVANDVFNASFGWFRREGGGAGDVGGERELRLRSLSFESETAYGRIGFASFMGQSARYGDLAEFISELAPHSGGLKFSFTEINGGVHLEDHPFVPFVHEVSHMPYVPLDQQATADSPSTTGSNEPYLELPEYLLALNDTDLPTVLSVPDGEEEQSVPEDYAHKVCNLFMQLGARGVSVIFASGDYGPGDSCTSNDSSTYFQPVVPATCPWITAVGATANRDDMLPGRLRPGIRGGSRGRVRGLLHGSERAFPDAATIGVNYAAVDQGAHYLVNGTSASAATFAGQVALLNAARLSSNLTALGFLNPLLYEYGASIFSDVTRGSSVGCVGNGVSGAQGASWHATEGWDPVTGLGVLNFTSFQAIVTPDAASDVGSYGHVGTGELSVAKEVAEVQKLLKASGLTYTMHSAGTTVEGSWDEVMRVIGQAHSVVHQVGPQRIQTSMRVGTRTDKKQTAADKVKRVEDLLAEKK